MKVHRAAIIKQGRIHGNPVADSWAGAVKQKLLAIQKCHGRTDQPADGPTNTARRNVACLRLITRLKACLGRYIAIYW